MNHWITRLPTVGLGLVALGLMAGCVSKKSVTIRTVPAGATVFIDGKDSGIAPLKKDLAFGSKNPRYDVTARLGGYEDGQTQIEFKPKTTTDYEITLNKLEAVEMPLISYEPTRTSQGVKLMLQKRATLAYLEVIERSPNVASVTRVTANDDKTVNMGAPVLSPAEATLVYYEIVQEENGTYSNLQKQRVGSPARTRLTYGKYRDAFPAFTPDGLRVVFSSNRTSTNETLWMVKSEGAGGISKLTNTQAQDYSPSVSPDGKFVAFASNPMEAEEPQIWTVPLDASLLTQLREGESPQVSPDGKKILFVRQDKTSKQRQLWLMTADGAAETQLTQNADYETVDPRWSPDGKWIVYASNEGFDSKQVRNFDIWLMAADGSKRTQLTTNGSWDDGPCWDHKGETIYFRSNRGSAWNIWRFQPILAAQ